MGEILAQVAKKLRLSGHGEHSDVVAVMFCPLLFGSLHSLRHPLSIFVFPQPGGGFSALGGSNGHFILEARPVPGVLG